MSRGQAIVLECAERRLCLMAIWMSKSVMSPFLRLNTKALVKCMKTLNDWSRRFVLDVALFLFVLTCIAWPCSYKFRFSAGYVWEDKRQLLFGSDYPGELFVMYAGPLLPQDIPGRDRYAVAVPGTHANVDDREGYRPPPLRVLSSG